MNPLTVEWIEKAEGDFLTASREFRARNAPNYDAVCFHAQQAAEKFLKAILQESGFPIPRTHSLADLLSLILKNDPSFFVMQPELNEMEGYAVQYRYPGQTADLLDARSALSAAKTVRIFVKAKLHQE
jgi:HEPN domain-containing protein